MPLLTPSDPLPAAPRRILVAGASGAGKSTLARRAGEIAGLPYTELDGLFHGPGWTPRPGFAADVAALAAAPRWVAEYQYPDARPVLGGRADLLVVLGYRRVLVGRRVAVRTLHRRWRHTVLWGGNVEPPLRTFLTDRDHVVRYAWRTWPDVARQVADVTAARPDLPVVVLTSPRASDAWCAGPLRTAVAGG